MMAGLPAHPAEHPSRKDLTVRHRIRNRVTRFIRQEAPMDEVRRPVWNATFYLTLYATGSAAVRGGKISMWPNGAALKAI